MRKGLILVLLAVWSFAADAAIYTWVDEDGEVHYSDRPHPGAQQLEVSTTLSVDPSWIPDQTLLDEAKRGLAGSYQSFSILEPQDKETIRTNERLVVVRIILEPALQAGHQIRYYLDGVRVGDERLTSTYFTIRGVERGPHSLRAELLDDKGQKIAETDQVVFILRKPARY